MRCLGGSSLLAALVAMAGCAREAPRQEPAPEARAESGLETATFSLG